MRLLLARISLAVLSTVVFLLIAECTWRVVGPAASVDRWNVARVEDAERQIHLAKRDLEIARHVGGERLLRFVESAPASIGQLHTALAEDVAVLEDRAGFDAEDEAALGAALASLRRAREAARALGPGAAAEDLTPLHEALTEALVPLRGILDGKRPTARQPHQAFRMYFETAEREEFTNREAADLGLLRRITPSPRPRTAFAPDSTFYICYAPPTRGYFDERGCVEVRLDGRGCRERPELSQPKPQGQRRIVCIGDSFTFGWGVPVELAWPRLVERRLRRDDDGIRTVNCGAAGAIYVDEYAVALESRFHAYEPDAVVVTLCLNDLIVTNAGLCHENRDAASDLVRGGRPWWRSSRLLSTLADSWTARLEADYPQRSLLRFPDGVDVSEELLASPPSEYVQYLYAVTNLPRSAFWPAGTPQSALRRMKAWCDERGIAFGVVVWPFFQGLGPDEHYPFAAIHEAVAGVCGEAGIPFLDLLPVFDGGRRTPEWWVNPADYHGNELAQQVAAAPVAEFCASLLGGR